MWAQCLASKGVNIMPSGARSLAIYKHWYGMLANATDRDYEQKVLPLLRLFWPDLVQVRPRAYWDRRGIDLMQRAPDHSIECAVQCKGFEVEFLGPDQQRQIEKSIDSFKKSGERCALYLVVHNRDGRNAEFRANINSKLRELVEIGSAEKVELWDGQYLLNRVHERMSQLLDESLRQRARQIAQKNERLFQFGAAYIPEVPSKQSILRFQRWEPCVVERDFPTATLNVAELVQQPLETGWTILTGEFGAGKSTVVRHVAEVSKRPVILIQASEISPHHFTSGQTTLLMSDVVANLEIFAEYTENDSETLLQLAAPTLTRLLRRPESDYLVIVDGLDENRAFTNLEGLQRISNQVAEFKCPVIFTTRSEHLTRMFGDFNVAFYEFSTTRGESQRARLIELTRWELAQVTTLIEKAMMSVEGENKSNLNRLLHLVQSNEHQQFYGDLIFHPLFLQFILEDVATRGIRLTDRPSLIGSWVQMKIRRDRSITTRSWFDQSIDTDEIVRNMMLLMENVAGEMTSADGDSVSLTESIESIRVQEEAQRAFRLMRVPVLDVLLYSVLVPLRTDTRFTQVGFALKVLQEYFLARYLVREGLPETTYPETVRDLCNEIRASET